MNKAVVFLLIAIVAVSTMLFANDGGATDIAGRINVESVKGDVVEIQGKGMYYKNKYGSYPVYADNIYDMSDSKVHEAIQTLERFFDKTYLEKNVKLVNDGELKSKGITYELANGNNKYFIDVLTGKVLAPELMDKDSDYLEDVTSTGLFKVVDTIIIKDSAGNEMTPINGSFDSGSNIYFYGGGAMKLARRDEVSNEISNMDAQVDGLTDVLEILYIQKTQTSGNMFRAAVRKVDGVHILELKIK